MNEPQNFSQLPEGIYWLPMPTFPDRKKPLPKDLRHNAIVLAGFLLLNMNRKTRKAYPALATIYAAMWPDRHEPRDATELAFLVLESWGLVRTRTHVWGRGRLGWDYHLEGLLARIEQATPPGKTEEV